MAGLTLWPEGADLGGEDRLDVLDLARRHVALEDPEDAAGDSLGVGPGALAERPRDVLQELLLLPLPERLVLRGPALVVEAAEEHRELGPEVDGLRHGQPVAQGVQ